MLIVDEAHHFKFQSTLSVRRATWRLRPGSTHRGTISIHALLEESDQSQIRRDPRADGFQSTLSVRRATPCRSTSTTTPHDFNPRSP